MWSTNTPRQIGLPPEFFFVAPTHHHPDAAASGISFDQHSLNAGLLSEDGRGGMQLWQQSGYQLGLNSPASYVRKPVILGADQHADLILSGGAATCQDCGNQAKKDCTHRRCRSCCKSRGFDCATHVKSTWVSAVRRRERQLMGSNTAVAASSQSQSTSSAKKPRLAGGASQTTSHTSTSNNDTSSSHQDAGSMPAQVNAPAVFKCVRVTSVEDGEDEYAYQAVVRIGGRVFKGFLYDQGVDAGAKDQGIFPNISDLQLGASSSNQAVDPTHDLYTGGGGLIGGSNYGNTMN